MQPKETTLFNIRYAVRVLERYAAFWSFVGITFKVLSILSGTVALSALVGDKSAAAVALGVVFAVTQAIEYSVSPSDRKFAVMEMRGKYAALYVREHGMSEDDLANEYRSLCAADDIIVPDAIRELAYNDTVREFALDESELFHRSPLFNAITQIG